jgi:hypothetical protein
MAAFDVAEIGTIRWRLFVKVTPVRLHCVGERSWILQGSGVVVRRGDVCVR